MYADDDISDAEMAQLVAALEESERSAKREAEARQATRVGCQHWIHLRHCCQYPTLPKDTHSGLIIICLLPLTEPHCGAFTTMQCACTDETNM